MHTTWRIPRRTFLRGLGATLAVPWLEAMSPGRAVAAAALPGTAPRRMAFVYIPNGANMADWTPPTAGADYVLPSTLEPLEPFRREVQVISGLAHDKARPNGDGAGDHARASATFLTGCQARKTSGADIKAGVSVDQLAAEKIGHLTRLPSLEMSCDKARTAGNCDSGYSCAYQFNISWKTESTPMPPEVDPRLVFERLFGAEPQVQPEADRARQTQYRKSILDLVRQDAQTLRARLGRNDQHKLDEYLSSVRDLELRIDRNERLAAARVDARRPDGIPDAYRDHLRVMYDLLALAFQSDTTRIATFIVAHDGSNRPYPFIGVPEGHHDLSHHGNDAAKKKKIAQINRFHMEQFAYFLERLQTTREGDGTLLDHCMIVYGGGIGDGNRHNHDNLPVLLCGRGGDTLRAGRHLKLGRETPMTNLYLALLDRLGVAAERVGDSTGRLEDV
jgi:hypothetical protein